jgi:ABC-type multidrug transport system fused ATPase/permease subunit
MMRTRQPPGLDCRARYGVRGARSAEERPGNRNLRLLGQLLSFLRRYRAALAGALVIAAGAVLGFGLVLRRVVAYGLSSGSVAARVYLVTWIGERVVADIRKRVFDRVLKLEPAFCRQLTPRSVLTYQSLACMSRDAFE